MSYFILLENGEYIEVDTFDALQEALEHLTEIGVEITDCGACPDCDAK